MKRIAIKICDVLFVVSVVLFVGVSLAMFLIQSFGLLTLNGALTSMISDVLVPRAGAISSVSAISTFILSYLRRTQQKE